jgi:hypothetical protein
LADVTGEDMRRSHILSATVMTLGIRILVMVVIVVSRAVASKYQLARRNIQD